MIDIFIKILCFIINYDLLRPWKLYLLKRKYNVKRLTTINAQKGMEVLLTHPTSNYKIGNKNPAVGTKYEVAGIIEKVYTSHIFVKWYNGTTNSYLDNTLSCINDIPEGNVNSIWD